MDYFLLLTNRKEAVVGFYNFLQLFTTNTSCKLMSRQRGTFIYHRQTNKQAKHILNSENTQMWLNFHA